jgi:hypothetical protein
MRLSELISFVRQIDRFPEVNQRQPRGGPLFDEPNAPSVVRPGVPPETVTGAHPIRDRGDLVLDLEQVVALDDLPPDVRAPNPPIDTLAYYLPFHRYESDWGIYLRESGVLVVASILKGSRLGPGDSAFINRGRQILLDHEHFHFQTEVACARAEVIARIRIYDAYFDDGFAAAHEEALANASTYRWLRLDPAEIRDRVSAWMKHQGPGYRDFDKWVDSGKFRAGCRRAGQHMLKTISGSRPSRPEPAEFLFDSIGRIKPPIYVVLDVSLASVLKPFPKAHGMRVLVHSRDHPPPHIHIQMPPGRDFTRYQWPNLEPLSGDLKLSSDGRKDLGAYLADYGREIDARVRTVYPGAEPWVPDSRSGLTSA